MTDRTAEFHDLVRASETCTLGGGAGAHAETPPSDLAVFFTTSVAQTTRALDRIAASVARFSERLSFVFFSTRFHSSAHDCCCCIPPLHTRAHAHTVAKTTSLFEERSAGPEAQRLAGEIQQSLVALAGRLDALEARCGSPHARPHAQTIAEHRAAVLAYLRLRAATLSDDYRTALQTRTRSLKEQQRRRPTPALSPTPADNGIRQRAGAAAWHSDDSEGASEAVGIDLGAAALAQEPVTTAAAARVRAVRQAESSLAQLQTMFTQVAGLLADQGEMLQHIDHNIDRTVLYVDDAHSILARQLAAVKRNRGLIAKLLVCTAVTVVLFFWLSR